MADLTGGMAALRLRSVTCTAVEVPLRYVLGTSAATVRAVPLLLVEVLTEQGVAGRSYVFCYRRSGAKSIALVLEDAIELVRGDSVAPLAIAAKLQRRFALIGVTGIVRMALSAFRLWVHHRTLPIDRTPSPSTVIDLREARTRLQLKESEHVAT